MKKGINSHLQEAICNTNQGAAVQGMVKIREQD